MSGNSRSFRQPRGKGCSFSDISLKIEKQLSMENLFPSITAFRCKNPARREAYAHSSL